MGDVRLYDGERVIGVVDYTENLDHWDGSNNTCGSTGRHLGVGKLKDGRFYLCHGTQWQGERDRAEVVTEEEAKSAILEHNADVWGDFFEEDLPNLTA